MVRILIWVFMMVGGSVAGLWLDSSLQHVAH